MSIIVSPISPVIATQGVADLYLQPGSTINAKVLQILSADQVRISIGGQSIDVQTQVPLQAGQSLRLAVSQTRDGIRLAVVPQPGASASQTLTNSGAGIDVITLAPDAANTLAAQAPGVTLANLLTPQEAQAVSVAAQGAATQQASLAPLFANLAAAAGLSSLPPQLQQAVAQLLAQRPNLDQNLSGADVQHAFESSGLFLEASLASGTVPSTTTPDLKAALIVLRQILTTTLNGATPQDPASQLTATAEQSAPLATVLPQIVADSTAAEAATIVQSETATTVSSVQSPLPGAGSPSPADAAHGDARTFAAAIADTTPADPAAASVPTATNAAARAAAGSAALSILQEAVQANPLSATNMAKATFTESLQLSLLPAVAGFKTPRVDDGTRSTLPPPPVRGALPTAQPVTAATIVANAPQQTTLRHLLHDTDAAIARQTLLQVASLPERNDAAARLDAATPRWNFEIPFAMPQGTAVAQFEISRDGGDNTPADAAQQVWRARFSIDVEPAGPVHALISLQGDKTSVRMWAERPATALQLQNGAAQLNQALIKANLNPGDIVIREGAPPQPAAPASGHFLDRAS
ncbi:flagellar hook-length control protein FliK [soil metagenome]